VLAGFLCVLLTTTAFAQPNAQKPLLEVLVELNKTKGVYFLFSQQQLGKTLVNVPVLSSNASIERMLTQVLRNTGLSFKKIDDRTFVILSKKRIDRDNGPQPVTATPYPDENPADPPLEDPSPGVIDGKVTDGEGKVLQGVSVTVKGTGKGTYTDLGGDFSIRAGKDNILIFSFVGYNNKEIPAGLAGKTSVILSPSDQPMTEVLVTALGIGKQEKSLGYSTAELDGSLFTQSREVNLGNALIGQVAGLNVVPNATGPYGSSRVLIRGNASLSGNNQPLYVIDGVPYDNANQGFPGQWGGADLGDGLSNINPDDIESIVVLKGVAASALYGYRGGNGAILVTTKSGSKTKGIGVQVNDNFTVNSAIDQRDYQYAYGQGLMGLKPLTAQSAMNAPYYSWGARMDGSAAMNYLGNQYPYSPARDNFRNFLNNGLTNQSSIALTGANNKGHFRLGVSDLHLNTVIPNSSMSQQGLNFNSTFFITNRLQMELKGDYVFEHVNNRASLSDDPGNVISAPLYLANTFDILWMKGHRVRPDGTEWLPGVTDPYFENPYYIAYEYKNKTDRNRLTGGLTLKYNLLDWLYLQGQVTRDGYLFNVSQVTPSGVIYTRNDGVHGGNLTQYTVNFHELNGSFMIGAKKKVGEGFSFTANVGGNQEDNINEISGIGAIPGTSNRAAGPFIIAGYYDQSNITNKPYTYLYRHYRVNSIFGSADLNWRNYLFLTTTLRNDWFSTLNIHTNSYLYPSVAGSFVFSDVIRLPSWFSLGKLRASYAASSNGTSPYQNMLTYGLQGYTVNGQQVGYVSTNGVIPDAYLRPVGIAEKEAGLYLKFLHDRIGLDLTWYLRQTTNDIVHVTVSPTSGYNQDIENVGKIRNRGLEMTLTGIPILTQKFKWNFSFNLAVNNNTVLYIGDLHSIVIDGAYPRWGSEVSVSNVVGLPYGQIMGFGYKRDGKGNIIFSDGRSNPAPAGEPEQTGLMPLGSAQYKQTGGFTNEFHYDNFSLSFLIDFKYGAKVYSGTNLLLYFYGLHQNTLQGREGGYIGKGVLENGHPNTIAVPAQQYFQDISAGGTDHIAQEFIYDASFIKLRSMSLGYSVPSSRLIKKFIKECKLSLVGRNLAILMKHTPNIDPESGLNNTNGQGLELSGYPAVRSWGINLGVKF